MENKKILLIPGWMNEGGMYSGKNGLYDVLEIWRDRISEKEKISADYLIGHSLGCNWALLNWTRNQNLKLILINPLLPRRSLFDWFLRWREFHKRETLPKNKVVVKGIGNHWFGIKQCFRLLRYDFDDILGKIPRDKITVICGEKDTFYCDEKFRSYIRSKNIPLIEIKNIGHDWHKDMDRKIGEIILK